MQRDHGTETSPLTSLVQGSTESRVVESYYDTWADTYDATLTEWQYRAPSDACDILVPHLNDRARVLDAGCGTGLLARVLHARGDFTVDGVDISAASLRIAERHGLYARLMHHDLQDLPLPVPDNAYDAAASIGVLTYIEDAEALLRDLCRCVRPGGAITFTQRTDLWQDRGFADTIDSLERAGLWTRHHVTPPQPYLPGNEEFSDDIKVIHTLCMVT